MKKPIAERIEIIKSVINTELTIDSTAMLLNCNTRTIKRHKKAFLKYGEAGLLSILIFLLQNFSRKNEQLALSREIERAYFAYMPLIKRVIADFVFCYSFTRDIQHYFCYHCFIYEKELCLLSLSSLLFFYPLYPSRSLSLRPRLWLASSYGTTHTHHSSHSTS